MILEIFVDIERVEFLGIKTGEEHADNETEVEREHIRLFLLQTKVNIIVIGTEILQ